ncbi:sugar phosphate isomerase/epimerase family protein [Engelhardtia mirabilis]|uniref:L-ribulose-5-phosphate 3-epimerase UlaE n=1 Tax=Engelhardtia mirabilis TaxID=2528011 RepID=A0A518BLL6_9BACT|nr:L-ribulose-5-phosphate 3-epimerase UlaE [Planctomycetes bacterium Pla133]QDV02190.1 L-ribulose-5-phosphate 3-epimerase UlaE [Planctomycetes bacterium Pla86]
MSVINRREVLGLGLGALALGGAAAAGQDGPGALGGLAARLAAENRGRLRGIKRSCKIGMVGVGETIGEKFQILRDLGYDGVELDSPSDLDRDQVLAAIEATGLRVPGVVDSVHWTKTLGDADRAVRAAGRKGLETALHDAKAFGASTVLLVPAVVNAQIRYDQAYERSVAEIERVVPLAKELGVTIAFENVWNNFLLSPLEAARYVDGFESRHVGWYLDLGNLVRSAWPDHWVHALGARIKKIDIKDYSRAKQNSEGIWAGFDCAIGAGDVGWETTMAALDSVEWGIGGEHWASAEVGGGDAARLAEILARMDDVLGR